MTKDLEKYKSHMEPIEKRVLGTSTSKSMISHFDEIAHEVEIQKDRLKGFQDDLQRVEADLRTIKAWRIEMPSVVEIMKRKVDKDDPVYGKLDNLKRMIDE